MDLLLTCNGFILFCNDNNSSSSRTNSSADTNDDPLSTSVGLLTCNGFILFCNDNNTSGSTTNSSADTNDDPLSPFAKISCALYTRLQDEWTKRQTAGVSELPPLNVQQRKAGSDFLQLCILAGEFRR